MNDMKPIASTTIPNGSEWLYEVKYDGFRCMLTWNQDSIRLTSKNNKDLTALFPELMDYCLAHQKDVSSQLPLQLDGELTVLNHQYQANFAQIQKRGRSKNQSTIQKAAQARPATFLAFDMLQVNGTDITKDPFNQRKNQLLKFFREGGLEENITPLNRLAYVPCQQNAQTLWETIFAYKGEGLIAKRKSSVYGTGKKHHDWYKVKNWRSIQCALTHFNPDNDYFTVNVLSSETWTEVGKCKHGLDAESSQTVKKLFTRKGEQQANGYTLPPAVCAEIHTLDLLKNELREPEFAQLLVHTEASDCTIDRLKLDMAMLPEELEVSNLSKPFWPQTGLTKGDLLIYLREISPYMLPFLHDRPLTLIRCPDGVAGESFFQKHMPDYAPSYVNHIEVDGEKLMICNQLAALLWFGNHGALEYHIPFQQAGNQHPSEIVFDLDPPDREHFGLAVQAAVLLKQILDDAKLISFVKTSGNKGLQVHIPIPEESMTYEETAVFTQAIAHVLETRYPDSFTTERMKKNRHGRLYIDYVQHGRDKTIIAPYSPRKTDEATVSMPLFWDELEEEVTPTSFTIANAVERVQRLGCPFVRYFAVKEKQDLTKVKRLIEG